MRIGYIKNNQSNSAPGNEEIEKIKNANVERIIVEIFYEQDSNSKNKETRVENENFESALLSCIDDIKEDDTLIVLDLNELGDSLDDIVDILKLIDKKGAEIEILDHYFKNININKKQLISTLEWVENKERKDIIKRQAKGLLVAKAKKMKGPGRRKKYSPYAENSKDREIYFTVIDMLKEDVPIKRIADLLNISRKTVYSIKDEINKEKDT